MRHAMLGGLLASATLLGACGAREVVWYEEGFCWHADGCDSDVECGSGRACSPRGRCTESMRMCGCEVDADCPSGLVCFTNEVVCGECITPQPRCPTGACAASTDVCMSGVCVERDAQCAP